MKAQRLFQMACTAGSVLLLGTSLIAAQRPTTQDRGQLSAKDYRFVMKAASSGTEEVQLGQLATQKGVSQSVRNFGEQMVTDHSKANAELRQLVTQKGATFPEITMTDTNAYGATGYKGGNDDLATTPGTSEMNPRPGIDPSETKAGEVQQQGNLPATGQHAMHSHMEHLQGMSGAEFDRAYAKMMTHDHKNDIREFRDAAKDLDDPDLRAWAQKTLPTLEQHERMAEDMHSSISKER